MNALDQYNTLHERIPTNGLLSDKNWRIAKEPLQLSARHHEILQKMGDHLLSFVRACDLLYRQSMAGKQPAWIAQWLNAGKPKELIDIANHPSLKNQIPSVLRPDLIVTENGFALCEIDSLPGGIGLTAWLQEEYARLDFKLCGGPSGIRNSFNKLFPEGYVVLADEGLDYLPEFEWLLGSERVRHAKDAPWGNTPLYRFVEAFDWLQHTTLAQSWSPEIPMTPPLKPHLEEKLWLALFHLRPLRPFWRRELGDKGIQFLEQIIPESWVVTPEALPPHAVIPHLNINNWREAGEFSQKERALVLKVSGFSPQAWGSRGVWIGQDLPAIDWMKAIEQALNQFSTQPHIMMRFIKGSKISQEWINDKGECIPMEGRVRLCPYFFVENNATHFAGGLSTLCPSDKKLIHGMSDAVLSPLSEIPAP